MDLAVAIKIVVLQDGTKSLILIDSNPPPSHVVRDRESECESLRDKDYVRTNGGMLFNVTGYEHPPGAVFASLKYVDGEKWTRGYDAACEYLAGTPFVEKMSGYIQVPLDAVEQCYSPRQRWAELRAGVPEAPLHREAIELAWNLGDALSIHIDSFGITDSLLWGDGHANSDIDLIVVGLGNVRKILERGSAIYEHVDFERPDPHVMTAPYGLKIADWPWLLNRKQHMGVFRGRLFSLRVVLDDHELPRKTMVVPEVAERPIEFEVADTSRSLLFPTVYIDRKGNELWDYSVVYEGVFREGEIVRCRALRERMGNGRVRYVVSGLCERVEEVSM